MQVSAKLVSQSPRPIREGLFRFDPPTLLGSRCRACQEKQFPARDFCPACDSEDVEAGVELSTLGEVYSFTVIHQAPMGRDTPYTLAYVDLKDGVRVMSQVAAPPESLAIGMPVELDIREVGKREGSPLIGYVFVPYTNSEGAR